MKKKIFIILAVILVLAAAGFFAYNKVSDTIVKKTLSMVATDSTIQEKVNDYLKAHPEVIPEELQGIILGGETEPGDEPAGQKEDSPEGNNAENAKRPGNNEKAETASPSKKSGGLSMNNLEGADKSYVMGIYSRFSASEISEVSSLMSGTLTGEKKARIKEIVFSKISSAELSRLYAIAAKYQ